MNVEGDGCVSIRQKSLLAVCLSLFLVISAGLASSDTLKYWIDPIDGAVPRAEERVYHTCLDFAYVLNPDGKAIITRWMGEYGVEEVFVPAQLEEHPVVALDYGAFADTSPNKVIIEEGIREIGAKAFQNAYLTEIKIPETVTSFGEEVFAECIDLESIYLPGSISRVPELTFYDCYKLRHISLSEGITEVDNTAFMGCAALRTIELPGSLVHFGSSGDEAEYQGNTWLFPLQSIDTMRSVTVAENSAVFASEDGVLMDKTRTTLIYYPPAKEDRTYQVPEGITSIEDEAFKGASNLTEVIFPASLIEIGRAAFEETSILSVEIPEHTVRIRECAFAWCGFLTTVVLPESLAEMDDHVFEQCDRLEYVLVIPDSYADHWCEKQGIPVIYPDAG